MMKTRSLIIVFVLLGLFISNSYCKENICNKKEVIQNQSNDLGSLLDKLYLMREQARRDLKSLSPKQADKYMSKYKKEANSLLEKINENIPEDSSIFDYLYNKENYIISTPNLIIAKKCQKAELKAIPMGEGYFILAFPNYYYKDLFYPYVTQEYKDLLSLKGVERDEPIIQDTDITDLKTLGDLVRKFEIFIAKDPNNKEKIEGIIDLYNFYVQSYVAGTICNSSVVEDGNDIDAERKKEFQRFIRKYPNSPSTIYIKRILAKDGSKEIHNTIREIYNKLYNNRFYHKN